ncbi:MAG: hypothetical protein IJM44_04385 [Ruminococcus sp.]|nr:hypothetical protein [Ruminococcus sp.]
MKSKGIVIELTALLDVILIMLFWVMLNIQDSSEAVKADAESRVAAAEQQLEEQKLESERALEELRQSTAAEIERANTIAANINAQAYANQQALDGFEKGVLVTLNLRYDNAGELYILNNSEQIGVAQITSKQDIADKIVESLRSSGSQNDDVILCAMIFDGNTALYTDVRTVSSAVETVRDTYKNFYCTYINTAR